uniref:Uncharacterized mitochondrial protein AtMg00810-like n=1 Tax=Tanacetum cinerariifolium TaxID=118510 RepID=A0A699GPH2_TANCI|nr:uncharacterized mitochondrial protein AtMg00810-like [Tanacetum cinerariifolium]
MKHYLEHTNYPIWEVIQKGNGHVQVSIDIHGQIRVLPPKTAKEGKQHKASCKAKVVSLISQPLQLSHMDLFGPTSPITAKNKANHTASPKEANNSVAKNGDEKLNEDTDSKKNEESVDKEDQTFLDELKRLKRQEKKANDISSMGELAFFLGLQVKQKEDGIFISQDKYVVEILKKFDFLSVKTAGTPIETKNPLVKDEEAADVDVHLYRSMIGSLMYLTASRHDIIYLKGQPKLGLWYPRELAFDLEAYFDSDYAGANLDRKSTIGYGEGSRAPIEPQPTPSPTHPSIEDHLLVTESSSRHDTTQDSLDLEGINRIEGYQAVEIIALKARIKKMEKKCKPSISHHRAWLKSVQRLSIKKRFRKKESRRLSKETEEIVSTARPRDSTVRPDVGTTDPIVPPLTTNIKDTSRPTRSLLTLKPLPTIDPKDEGKGFLEEPEPAKKMTRSDLDAAQIAKDAEVAILVYEEELAELERKKEKRHREEEASMAIIAEMYNEVQAGIEANALFTAKLQPKEREEYTIKERAKFLAETIAAQRKFRAAQRSAEIRSLYERQKKVIDDFKPVDSNDAVDKEKVLEELDNTMIEVKQEGDEENIRKRTGTRLKMKGTKKSKRKKTDFDLKEEEHLKTFL